MKRYIAAVLLSFVVIWPSVASEKPNVVTSFSLLEDIVFQIGGEQIALYSVVKRGGDGHVYQPTPSDLSALNEADLLVSVGAGFEGWFERASGSRFKGQQLTLADLVNVNLSSTHSHDHHHGHGEHASVDPHFWLDIANIIELITPLTQQLSALAPEHKGLFQARAQHYLQKLTALDEQIKTQFARLPHSQRKVITAHMAYNYFGQAYGVEFLAPQGISTEEEPSARDIAQIIKQIRSEHIAAVFMEHNADPRVVQQIASETDAVIGGTLYAGTLTAAGGKADTYLKLMQHNANTILHALSAREDTTR